MIPIVKTKNKLKWKFENVKDLTEDGINSDKFSINGVDWCINACTDSDEDDVKWLKFFLLYDSDNKNDKNWICNVDATYKLLDQKGTGKHLVEKVKVYYSQIDENFGTRVMIKWDEFISNDDGYLKDDSIVIEIEFDFKYYDFSKKVPNFTDIIVKVENTEFHLNKGVLSLKSSDFYNFFVEEKSEDTVIKLNDIGDIDFCHLLASFDPFFDGVTKRNYENLIKIAKKLGVPSLHHYCEQFLLTYKMKTLFEKIKIADENGYEKLMESCIAALKTGEDIKILHSNEKFDELTEETKLRIMRRFLDFY